MLLTSRYYVIVLYSFTMCKQVSEEHNVLSAWKDPEEKWT